MCAYVCIRVETFVDYGCSFACRPGERLRVWGSGWLGFTGAYGVSREWRNRPRLL